MSGFWDAKGVFFSHLLAVLSEARLAQRLTPWW